MPRSRPSVCFRVLALVWASRCAARAHGELNSEEFREGAPLVFSENVQAQWRMYHSSDVYSGYASADSAHIVDMYTATSQERLNRSRSGASLKQIFTLCVIMYGSIGFLWLVNSRLPKDSLYTVSLHVMLLCVTWASTSVGMHVLNKSLATKLQAPALISMAQMYMAVMIVGVASYKQFYQAAGKQMCYWMVVPCFFAAMLCTSFYTYEYISLSLLTVIRNLTPLIVLPIERTVMPMEKRPRLSFGVVGSILTMLAGALIYAGGIQHISAVGVIFALANMVLAVSDRLIQRRLLTTECRDLPSGVCTIFNNFFGSLPTLCLAFATHQTRDAALPEHADAWRDPRVLILLALSGIIGIGICYLGFECQRAISATSFFVLQNVSKVAVVGAGIVFFQDPIRSPLTVIGLVMSLGGSFLYGKAQMSLAEQQAEETKRLLHKHSSA